MVKDVLGGGLRVSALKVAGMSESLKSVSGREMFWSTLVLPQSTTLFSSVRLGPTAFASSSMVSDGSVMPTMRTYMGSDMGPSRWHVNCSLSSISPWPLMTPVCGSTPKKPMVCDASSCGTISILAGSHDVFLMVTDVSYA
jgi:hypothetical protein